MAGVYPGIGIWYWTFALVFPAWLVLLIGGKSLKIRVGGVKENNGRQSNLYLHVCTLYLSSIHPCTYSVRGATTFKFYDEFQNMPRYLGLSYRRFSI